MKQLIGAAALSLSITCKHNTSETISQQQFLISVAQGSSKRPISKSSINQSRIVDVIIFLFVLIVELIAEYNHFKLSWQRIQEDSRPSAAKSHACLKR
jgi:hypothetical protein